MASFANRRARRALKHSHLKILTYASNLLIALFLSTDANGEYSCHKDKYTVLFGDGTILCENCEPCDKGQEPSPSCGTRVSETEGQTCVPCKSGISFSDNRGVSSCELCGPPCAKGQTVLQQCTPETNVKCGKSCYEVNMYFDAEKGCLPCSLCCGENGKVQDECKQKLGAESNMICSFISNETECRSATKQTPLASETTKKSSMQKNGHPDKNKTMITVAISVSVVSFVLIMFAVVVVWCRCARRGFCSDSQKAIEDGRGQTSTKENSKQLKTLREKEDVLQPICLALDNDINLCGNFNLVAQKCGYSLWRMSALLQCSPKFTNDFKVFILTVTI